MTSFARWGPAMAVLLTLGMLPARGMAVGPGDGLYGRFDADFTLSVGVGGGVLTGIDTSGAIAVGELRLRHLDAAGPFFAAHGGGGGRSAVMAGIELRPLFPALFLQNRFFGHERLDLLVQSLGVEVGAGYVPLAREGGLALVVGLGLEVPLVLPSTWAQGLWLRLGARHLRGLASDRLGPERDRADWTFYATLSASFPVGRGIARREVPRYRP